jgi:hypothetical protein
VGSGTSLIVSAMLECRSSCQETRLSNLQLVDWASGCLEKRLVDWWPYSDIKETLIVTLSFISFIDGPWSAIYSRCTPVLYLHVEYMCGNCIQLGRKPSTFRLTYNNIRYCNVVFHSLMCEKSIKYYPVMKWTDIQTTIVWIHVASFAKLISVP